MFSKRDRLTEFTSKQECTVCKTVLCLKQMLASLRERAVVLHQGGLLEVRYMHVAEEARLANSCGMLSHLREVSGTIIVELSQHVQCRLTPCG